MFHFTLLWIILVFVLLWFGNRLITHWFDRLLSWRRYGNIRFFAHLLAGIFYSLLVANGTYASLKLLFTIDPPTLEQIVVMNVYGAIIFIPAFSLYFSLQFLRSWRKSELASEKFQKESMRSRLESLKSHLDPHFLFNNLNILSSLIETDPARSKTFLLTFSDVYRMILHTKSEDLISLESEIRFIEKYFFLLENRFGDAIRLEMNLPEELLACYIPPLTLQILVENAMKHNRISERKPLLIRIYSEGRVIVVSNSLNLKAISPSEKSGSGLDNIRKRFSYFDLHNVRVITTPTEFQVHLPLIEQAKK